MSDISKFLNYENPEYSAIPDIPLYMDQLLDYLHAQLEPLRRTGEDAILTKTMVNNYVKSKVVDAPEKKKYQKPTIADLILVYHLKQCFSLQDIQSILALFKHEPDYYTHFSKAQSMVLNEMSEASFENLDNEAKRHLILSLSAEASIKKKLAEQLLDQLSR